MENYIVSARKYRPTTFDTVVGQHALTTTLKNAIATGKLAHAYLFCGPRGVGKTTCARIFAKTINCLSPTPAGEACGHCESCVAFDEQRSYNIHELDAASNNSVEDIRSLIEQVRIPPQVGKYKVFIIDEVHMLSTAAFNAFLKTLEEPPEHAIFILATTEKHKILPTILSRCQIYDFNRMEVGDIVRHLAHVAQSEGVGFEEQALHVIAQKADGGMRDALSIFDQVVSYTGGQITYEKTIENLNVLDYEYYFRLTDQLLAGEVSSCLLTFNEILAKGFEGNHFIGGLASHFRDLLVSRDEVTLPLLEVADSVKQRYREQAQRCAPRFLYRALKLCNDCDMNYRTSRNKRLLVELTLIEVAQLSTDEPAGSGLGPTKSLKPLFSAGAASAPTSAAPANPVAATEKTNAATENSIAATGIPNAATGKANVAPGATLASEQAAAYGRPAPAADPATQSARPATAKELLTRSAAGQNRGGLKSLTAVSIRHRSEATAGPADQPTQPAAEADWGDAPFDERELSYQWFRFANSLPQEQAAMAARMKNLTPRRLEAETYEVVLDNEQVMHYMQALVPEIETYLRRELKNGKVCLRLRVAAPGEQVKAYSKKEQFQMMLQRSEGLQLLRDELNLTLA